MLKNLLILGLLFMVNPVWACWGNGCSTYYGDIYSLQNKFTGLIPLEVRNPRVILDDPKGTVKRIKEGAALEPIKDNMFLIQTGNYQYYLPGNINSIP